MTTILQTVFTGICQGFGSAIGTYLALKYAVDHLDKIPSVKEKVVRLKEKIKL